MITTINPANHFWIIGGSTTDVYSSASNTLVALDDQTYVDWTANNAASNILNEAELADVLRLNGSPLAEWLLQAPSFIQPTPTTFTQDQLKAYSADARWHKENGGIVVNGIPFPTDQRTTDALNTAFIYTQSNAAATFSWKLPDGTFVTIDKQGIADLQSAVSAFGQSCFACEDSTATAIDSDTVTDIAAIDAAYAAVPNTFPGALQRRK